MNTEVSLKRGDWVEVRSREEILATLDDSGLLKGMPFMPEMLQFCGRRYQVDSRAVIACDTVLGGGSGRALFNAVHLQGVRCDGSAHGGCQALCLLFWREQWLKPVSGPGSTAASPQEISRDPGPDSLDPDLDALHRFTTRPRLPGATLYRCQATELHRFTYVPRRRGAGPLLRVLRSGNVTVRKAASVLFWGLKNELRRRRGIPRVPRVEGRCVGATPSGRIEGLQPGDWVEIKEKEEIEATLGPDRKNRGLSFDVEMLAYCGRKMRLLRQVDRIIEERTGAMIRLPNDCWIIDEAMCSGHLSRGRLFCTRKIYPYWREIWFRRTSPPTQEATRTSPPSPSRP
jgi:hypothetical protein